MQAVLLVTIWNILRVAALGVAACCCPAGKGLVDELSVRADKPQAERHG
jgi:hypothetical protein